MQRDHTNYDYLSVSVKNDQLERILSCYAALGWRVVKREGDRQYYNMKFVVFRRPHKIENKDRLQYLQVRMENALNNMSAIVFKRHRKSAALFAVLMLLSLGLIALGLWLFFGLMGGAGFIGGIISLSAAAAVIVSALIALFVLRKKEDAATKQKIDYKLELLHRLTEEAESLAPSYVGGKPKKRGGMNDEQK